MATVTRRDQRVVAAAIIVPVLARTCREAHTKDDAPMCVIIVRDVHVKHKRVILLTGAAL